jgi:hypothetical protein
MTDEPKMTLARKRMKIMLITFAVVLGIFGTLYILTENESTAPFVYAIF